MWTTRGEASVGIPQQQDGLLSIFQAGAGRCKDTRTLRPNCLWDEDNSVCSKANCSNEKQYRAIHKLTAGDVTSYRFQPLVQAASLERFNAAEALPTLNKFHRRESHTASVSLSLMLLTGNTGGCFRRKMPAARLIIPVHHRYCTLRPTTCQHAQEAREERGQVSSTSRYKDEALFCCTPYKLIYKKKKWCQRCTLSC